MARPAMWRPRHLRADQPQLSTVAPDGTTARHFPVQCSRCRGTHMLAERPSLAGSPRVYCQQCRGLVRLRRCKCLTCSNFLEKCDCSQRSSAGASDNSPCAIACLGGPRAASTPSRPGRKRLLVPPHKWAGLLPGGPAGRRPSVIATMDEPRCGSPIAPPPWRP